MEGLSPLELSVGSMMCAFVQFQDEDGKVSKNIFCKCLKEQMPSFDSASVGEHLFKTVDINKDGKLEFKEFTMLVCSFAWSNYKALEEAMNRAKSKHQ